MKRNIKLFFLDLDGTLLDEESAKGKVISKENLAALEAGEEKGYQSCISTGRIGPKALKYLKMSKLDYAITGNGAQIINKKGDILRELNILPLQMEQIKTFAIAHDLAFKIDNERIAYNVISDDSKYIAKRLEYKLAKNINYDSSMQRVKIIVWGKSSESLPNLISKFKSAVPKTSIVSAERGWTLEITNELATKAEGNIWAMKNLFHINDVNACCHIGDTMNDFPVIGKVGYFISPLDAQKDLLNKAPYLTVEHFKHAVSEVMNGNFWKNPNIK